MLCLEVAEHIPREFEDRFVANLNATARDGLVLSWSASRVGVGHVNPQSGKWVTQRLRPFGWALDRSETAAMRASVQSIFWLRDTILVLRRVAASDSRWAFD